MRRNILMEKSMWFCCAVVVCQKWSCCLSWCLMRNRSATTNSMRSFLTKTFVENQDCSLYNTHTQIHKPLATVEWIAVTLRGRSWEEERGCRKMVTSWCAWLLTERLGARTGTSGGCSCSSGILTSVSWNGWLKIFTSRQQHHIEAILFPVS